MGGRELMNIGWEWGVPEEELSVPCFLPGTSFGTNWLRPEGLYPSVI
jgi:hypothetical protein